MSHVIISYPKSPLPKVVEPAGTEEAELGLARFGALSKGAGLRNISDISRKCPMPLLKLDSPYDENTAGSTVQCHVCPLSLSTCVSGAGEPSTVFLALPTPW